MNIVFKKMLEIEENPSSFLESRSLHLLKCFIDGYIFRQSEEGNFLNLGIEDFSRHIHCIYADNSTKNWATILLTHHEDSKKAFEAFFRLLKDYCQTLNDEVVEYNPNAQKKHVLGKGNISSVLQMIKDCPLKYIGCYSIVRLKAFIRGYSEREYELSGTNHMWENFNSFIRKNFDEKEKTKSTHTIVSRYNDEKEAFQVFCDLLDEYIIRMREVGN